MKIAVASCAKIQQINPQPVWREIQNEKPDVLMLIGDTIYLDKDDHTDPDKLRSELRGLYTSQLSEPNFTALIADVRARNATVLAIYDDHDFLGNNRYGADHDPALREVARDEFIRAFSPPQIDGEVYQFHRSPLVDIILLDQRYYRQNPVDARANPDAILGVKQWKWFEQAVASSTAKYLVVASSSTFHTYADESWEQYPAAFNRMRKLLQEHPERTMVVSGDVHRNALCDDSGVVEVVSSAVARKSIVFGQPRKNYGILTFNEDAVRIDLRSLKAGWRFDVTLSRATWHF